MAKARRSPRGPAPQRRLSHEEREARLTEQRRQRVPSRSSPEDLAQELEAGIRVRGKFPWHRVELVLDGEAVSSLAVTDFEQQIGARTVRMAGIGGVGTRQEHRLKGYSRRAMENALRWMRREGFDTSMLYGITSFYPKFGFAEAFPGVESKLAVRDAETVRPTGCRFVDYAPQHLRAALRMYRASNAGRTGPTRRDPRHWYPWRKGLHYGSPAACSVALDARGRAAGYVVCDSGFPSATVIEVGWRRRAVFPDLLRHVARRAVEQRLEHVRLLLPEDDAFVAFCVPLGLEKAVRYRRDGGGMVRMINIPTALAKVADDLAARMSGPGSLTLRTNLDDVGLAWAGGRLSVGPPRRRGPQARLPQWAVAQLLYGYRSAEELADAGVLKGSREAVGALGEMFPVRPHHHYLVDHF